MIEKQCTKCKFPKALVLFYKNGRGGRMSTCIICTKRKGETIIGVKKTSDRQGIRNNGGFKERIGDDIIREETLIGGVTGI